MKRYYYDDVSSISRLTIDEGMEEITIAFVSGGKVKILTERSLLWIDPDVH